MTLVSTRIGSTKTAGPPKRRIGEAPAVTASKLAFRSIAPPPAAQLRLEARHTLNMSASGVPSKFLKPRPVGSILNLPSTGPGLYYDKPMVRLFSDRGRLPHRRPEHCLAHPPAHEFCRCPRPQWPAPRSQPGNRRVSRRNRIFKPAAAAIVTERSGNPRHARSESGGRIRIGFQFLAQFDNVRIHGAACWGRTHIPTPSSESYRVA